MQHARVLAYLTCFVVVEDVCCIHAHLERVIHILSVDVFPSIPTFSFQLSIQNKQEELN